LPPLNTISKVRAAAVDTKLNVSYKRRRRKRRKLDAIIISQPPVGRRVQAMKNES
jgi:hypothetical protein